MDPGGLSPPPGFLLRDLDCELGLLTMWSIYLVRTVSMFYNILYFIPLFIIRRRNWRIITAQQHPLLQQDRGVLAASWTNDCGESCPLCGEDWRHWPALPLMMKTTWTGISLNESKFLSSCSPLLNILHIDTLSNYILIWWIPQFISSLNILCRHTISVWYTYLFLL